MPAREQAALALALLLTGTPSLAAQSVRVHTTSTVSFVQLRPIHFDSTSGQFVPDPVQAAGPATEDVEVSAWDLGIQGLRFYGLARGRAALGSDLVWPQSDDHFDALAAYFELQRSDWRLRLGRQQHASGLGLYGFDGGDVAWQAARRARIEIYGGRGLERGTNDPLNSDAIRGLELLIPDHGTLLVGVGGRVQPTGTSTISATYQREVLDDLSGVVTERAALDVQTQAFGRWTLSGAMDWDFVAQAVGRAKLEATVALPHGASVSAELFRYRPVVDLSTIWGAFAPQGNEGAALGVRAAPRPDLQLSADYTLRRYEATTVVTPFLSGVGTLSHTLSLGARYTLGAVTLAGTYRLLAGYGSTQSGGDVEVVWNRAEAWGASVTGTAFQQTDEFRVARGTVIGFGGEGHVAIGQRLVLRGRLMQFANTGTSGGSAPDWSQMRATLQVDWTFGASADHLGGYR
jgi:hypothetical protein